MVGSALFQPDVQGEEKGECMKREYSAPLTAAQLANLADEDIDVSDIPELDESFWENAKLVKPKKVLQEMRRVARGKSHRPSSPSP